jgi:hypothetical protein
MRQWPSFKGELLPSAIAPGIVLAERIAAIYPLRIPRLQTGNPVISNLQSGAEPFDLISKPLNRDTHTVRVRKWVFAHKA